MDKRARAQLFRQRMAAAMERAELTRSGLARATGVDRSTVGQLLAEEETRLPNAQFVAEAAAALRVSADWLLGLSERPERPGDLIAAAMTVSEAARSSADATLMEWHREAAGYKIRHVPATLPDILKTEAVMRWEYADHLGRTPDQAIRDMRDKVEWLLAGDSDYEIAMPLYELDSLAEGSGYYGSLPREVRADQLDELARFCREAYPSLRLFLFDRKRVYSAPITVFGPVVAAVYVGRFFLAFRERERVRSLARHFDWLVREAAVDAREAADHVARLRDRV
ncbi:MAG: helix-turn-helix domain-containing protein [Pseudomonadota bacterium]